MSKNHRPEWTAEQTQGATISQAPQALPRVRGQK